jgi:HEAT repeat protein
MATEFDNDAVETRPEMTLEDFQGRLAALRDGSDGDATIFSDLDRAKLAATRRAWPALPVETRRRLVAAMAEMGEENIEYNFGRVLKLALRDEDAGVRAGAIAGLWEDESEDVLAYLLDEALRDPDLAVREAATRALARFSQLAVEDEIAGRWFAPIREKLLGLVRGGDSAEVRRRALEALAVYTDDAEVTGEIERAYGSTDEGTRMSAVFAMGRNLDGRWLDTILKEMDSDAPGMRYEATKASGEFGDRRAVPQLIERLGDDDREVQLAAIGSLGRIGGNASITILKRLAGSQDEVVREAAEEALDEASFLSNPIGIGSRLDTDREA